MDAPDMGGVDQGEAENVAQRVVVNSRCHRGNQYHRQACGLAVFDGTELCPRQCRAPECFINLIVQSVKLEEDHADTDLCQMFRIARFVGYANTVGIQLKKGEALLFSQRDDFVQILPHGRLAAGQLSQRVTLFLR